MIYLAVWNKIDRPVQYTAWLIAYNLIMQLIIYHVVSVIVDSKLSMIIIYKRR